MITYTTPTLMMTIKGARLENVAFVITIEQGSSKLTFDDPTLQYVGCNTVLSVQLTQEQTAALAPGMAKVQVNWTDGFGHRNATKIKSIAFGENLLKEVI